jgi:hypothetical protein
MYKEYVVGDETYSFLPKYLTWKSDITSVIRKESRGRLGAKAYAVRQSRSLCLSRRAELQSGYILDWADSKYPSMTEAIKLGAATKTAQYLLYTPLILPPPPGRWCRLRLLVTSTQNLKTLGTALMKEARFQIM